MTTCRLSELVSPAFAESHRAVKAGEINELVEKGGRGGAKSSYISIEVILLLLKHPDCHAVVMRKVGKTLRTSVYAQICWAISVLGLSSRFKCTVSPMECTYLPTGQKIMFMGLDDPSKLKSIKVPFGYIGVAWFEELDQFDGPEQVRNVEQSLFRGGPFSFCFKSFNPPAMARNWANQYALEQKAGKRVHHSTYLTTPEEWLGPRFLADAEHLKDTNDTAYRHEYLGEVVGSGTAVFEQLELREITDEELSRFDRIFQGEDWGWYPDAYCFIRCYYDSARETIYILDEHYCHKQSNESTGQWILENGYADYAVTADSAEPKSINDHIDMGIRCLPAIKGPGSIEYGMKWMQRRRIVIDPVRTPNAAREFSEYEYERDRDGNVISGYPDVNNHSIDATRYALSPMFMRRGNTA